MVYLNPKGLIPGKKQDGFSGYPDQFFEKKARSCSESGFPVTMDYRLNLISKIPNPSYFFIPI